MEKHYLIPVYGSIEPTITGSFDTEKDCLVEAKRLYQSHEVDIDDDILLWLTIPDTGKPEISAVSLDFAEEALYLKGEEK
jgi:hypothetical protein